MLYVGHFQLFWLNIQTNLPNSDIKIWSHWPPKITCSTLQKNAPRVVLSCTLKYFYRSFLNQSKYMDQMFNRISLESWCIRALSFHCCYLVSIITYLQQAEPSDEKVQRILIFLRKHLRHQSFLLHYKRNAEICTDRFLGDFKVDSPNNNSLKSQIRKLDMQKCCTLFSVFFWYTLCDKSFSIHIKSVT